MCNNKVQNFLDWMTLSKPFADIRRKEVCCSWSYQEDARVLGSDTSQLKKNHKNHFASSKVKNKIDLYSLGICASGPQVFTHRPHILRGVRIWALFRGASARSKRTSYSDSPYPKPHSTHFLVPMGIFGRIYRTEPVSGRNSNPGLGRKKNCSVR